MGSRLFAGTAAGVMLFCVLASEASAASAGLVPVRNAPEVPSVSVRYDDLNLNASAGVQRLFKRIVAASERVCPEPDHRQILLMQQRRACLTAAVSRAVESVDHPNLTAFYRSRSGTRRLAAQ